MSDHLQEPRRKAWGISPASDASVALNASATPDAVAPERWSAWAAAGRQLVGNLLAAMSPPPASSEPRLSKADRDQLAKQAHLLEVGIVSEQTRFNEAMRHGRPIPVEEFDRLMAILAEAEKTETLQKIATGPLPTDAGRLHEYERRIALQNEMLNAGIFPGDSTTSDGREANAHAQAGNEIGESYFGQMLERYRVHRDLQHAQAMHESRRDAQRQREISERKAAIDDLMAKVQADKERREAIEAGMQAAAQAAEAEVKRIAQNAEIEAKREIAEAAGRNKVEGVRKLWQRSRSASQDGSNSATAAAEGGELVGENVAATAGSAQRFVYTTVAGIEKTVQTYIDDHVSRIKGETTIAAIEGLAADALGLKIRELHAAREDDKHAYFRAFRHMVPLAVTVVAGALDIGINAIGAKSFGDATGMGYWVGIPLSMPALLGAYGMSAYKNGFVRGGVLAGAVALSAGIMFSGNQGHPVLISYGQGMSKVWSNAYANMQTAQAEYLSAQNGDVTAYDDRAQQIAAKLAGDREALHDKEIVLADMRKSLGAATGVTVGAGSGSGTVAFDSKGSRGSSAARQIAASNAATAKATADGLRSSAAATQTVAKAETERRHGIDVQITSVLQEESKLQDRITNDEKAQTDVEELRATSLKKVSGLKVRYETARSAADDDANKSIAGLLIFAVALCTLVYDKSLTIFQQGNPANRAINQSQRQIRSTYDSMHRRGGLTSEGQKLIGMIVAALKDKGVKLPEAALTDVGQEAMLARVLDNVNDANDLKVNFKRPEAAAAGPAARAASPT